MQVLLAMGKIIFLLNIIHQKRRIQHRPGMEKDAPLALAGKTTQNTARGTQKCIALEIGNIRNRFVNKDRMHKAKIVEKGMQHLD